MSGTVDPVKLSPELHRLIFHGVDVLEALAAGMFCLSGMARGAVEPIGPKRAEEIVTRYDDVVFEAERTLRAFECKASTRAEFEEIHQLDEDTRSELVDLLAGQVDWRDRALRKEDREERDAAVLGQFESVLRELCGPAARSPSDLAHLVDGLQGSVLSTALQRDEQAAFAVMLLEHLRRLPTSEMNEGLENIHHAVCASPRTSETEAKSIALLEAQVSIQFLDKLRQQSEYNERLADLVEKQDNHYMLHLQVLSDAVLEAKRQHFPLLAIGALSGAVSVSLVYGLVRFFS